MLYSIVTAAFGVFDSVLSTIFFLKFNGYKVRDKLFFLSLIPVFVIIMEFFSNLFYIFVTSVSILISFHFMRAINFNRKTRLRCLWSVILFYGIFTLVNLIVYNVFQIFIDIKIIDMMEQTNVNVAVCIISKSILLLTIKMYIYLSERLECKNKDRHIFILFYTSVFDLVLIIIIMQIRTIERSTVFTLLIVALFISRLTYYYMYAKLCRIATLERDCELLNQKKVFNERMYEERYQQFENVARINHDIQNHLMYVAYNIKKKEYNKARDYIEKIVNKRDVLLESIFLTNNNLNFIINSKIEEARKRGIWVTAQIEDVKDCVIEDYDLCSLLGNILDNAIESAENEKEKHIMIEIYNYSGYQIYSIKNRVEKPILIHNLALLTSKKDKENHGYGMKQIQNIIDNYQGHIDIYEKGKYFNIKVLIPREI